MKLSIAMVLAVFGMAAQGVANQKAPAGCSDSFDGSFEVAIVNAAQKRDVAVPVQKRDCGATPSILVVKLDGGVLTDAKGRTGYIASNHQFQFDQPPQAGAIVTSGFSVCGNNSLALGSSTIFYQCPSGSFYNLYDDSWSAQCQPVHINVITCDAKGAASQAGDGQIVGTTLVATTIVTVLSDGQPQAVPTKVPIPMCQIGDGQVQVHTTPCASIPVATPTAQPVSQISDGQIQVPPPSSSAPAAPGASAPASQAPAAPTSAGSGGSASAGSGGSASAPPSSQTSAPPSAAGAPKVASSLSALAIGVVAIMWLV